MPRPYEAPLTAGVHRVLGVAVVRLAGVEVDLRRCLVPVNPVQTTLIEPSGPVAKPV
jgi:hypothetical protein